MAKHYVSRDIDRPTWLGGGQWLLRDATDITIIFGKNGSGKSMLLRAMNEKFSRRESLYVTPERAGDFSVENSVAQRELDPDSRASSRRTKNFSQEYRRESLSRISALTTKIGTVAGHGLPLPNSSPLVRIEEHLSKLLPEFRFRITDNAPFYELWRVGIDQHDDAKVGSPNNELSSGETESITLALDLLTICSMWEVEKQVQRVLLLDEPDSHLHPDLQVRFASFVVELVKEFGVQVFLSTHSTTLLAAFGHYGKDMTSVVYLNNSRAEHRASKFSEELNMAAAVLGGHALIGPLFGSPLLLVEGDDDYQIWSHVPRQPGYRNLLAVIPCGGEQIRKFPDILDQLFGSLRDNSSTPSSFVLYDGDKEMPSHTQYTHVRVFKLNCRESENLYLTDEVLNSMGLTWEDAQTRIVAVADEHPEVRDRLSSCQAWDRSKVDLKGLIGVVSRALDSRELRWTTRVGQVVGRQEPNGQLREFLGNDLVTALWQTTLLPRK